MVTKQEIYGGQAAFSGGITETIRKRTEQSEIERLNKEEKQTEIILEQLKKGEITNINQIPQNIRRYFNIEQTLIETKNVLNEQIQSATLKEKELQSEYDRRVNELRDWRNKKIDRAKTKEEKESIRENYELDYLGLKDYYLPEIDYYKELSKRSNEQISKINSGEIITKDYALQYVTNYAKYEKDVRENRLDNEYNKLRIEEAKGYIDKINKGELKVTDIPTYLNKYINISYTKTSPEIETISKTEKVQTPTIPTINTFQDNELSKYILERGAAEKEKIDLETERYKDLGYTSEQSKILAKESLSQGGVSFTPSTASKIITQVSIEKQNAQFKEDLKDSFKNIGENIKKVGEGVWNTIKLDNKNYNITNNEKPLIDSLYKINKINNNENTTIRDVLTSIQEFSSLGIQYLSNLYTQAQYKSTLLIEPGTKLNKELKERSELLDKMLSKIKSPVNKYLKEIPTELKDVTEIKTLEESIKNLQNKINAGIPTIGGQIGAIGTDIALDILIPPKGYADLILLVNQIIPRKENMVNFLKEADKNGMGKTIKELPPQIGEKINNFITNKEQREEILNMIDENKNQIKELEKGINEGKYDKTQTNYLINEYKSQNNNLELQLKQLKGNTLLTIGTIGFLVFSLGKAKFNKIKAKKANLDLNVVKKAVDNYNKIEANKLVSETTPYVKDTYSGLKLTPADLRYLQDELKVINKGVSLDEINNIEFKVNSKEYYGNAFVKEVTEKIPVKKNIIQKIKDIYTPPENLKLKYYIMDTRPNFFQNSLSLTITLKNGKTAAFSISSKSNKNLINLLRINNKPNILNALKHGTNRKLIISQKISDTDIVSAIQFRQRAGRLKAEEYYFGREIADKTYGVKTSPKVLERLKRDRNKINKMGDKQLSNLEKELGLSREEILRQTKLSPEEIWGLGTPKAIVKETPKKTTTPKTFMDISDRGINQFTRIRQVGIQKIKNNDVIIDLSTFNFLTKNNIDNLKSIPKGKRTTSQNTAIEISNKVDNAISNGKSNLVIENQLITKLSAKELNNIQNAITSTIIPKQKFTTLISKTELKLKQSANNIKNITKINNNILTSTNKISSEINSSVWTGITNLKSASLLNELETQSTKLDNTNKLLTSQSLIIEKDIKLLTEQLSGITNRSQMSQIQSLIQKYKLKNDTINQLINQNKSIKNNIEYLKNKIPGIPKIPIGKKKKDKTEKEVTLKENEYGIFSRTKGKDFLVGKRTTKKKAKNLLFNTLDNTLRASGFIKKGKEKIKIKDFGADFKLSKVDPFRIVEKSKSRINTPGEKRELKRAKEKSKKTKRKSAEEYWFK